MPRLSPLKEAGLCNKCGVNPRVVTAKRDYTQCNPCMAAQRRAWRKTPTGFVSCKHADIKKAHGKDALAIYESLMEQQEGRCAICDRLPEEAHKSDKRPRLYIDHDHTTGTIRGLLCNQCNSGLGKFQDSPEIIRKAATYLEGRR